MEGVIREGSARLILDHYISHTGDDIAILMTHTRGEGDERIHKLAWDAFLTGTNVARKEGLYGAAGSAQRLVLRKRERNGAGGGGDGD